MSRGCVKPIPLLLLQRKLLQPVPIHRSGKIGIGVFDAFYHDKLEHVVGIAAGRLVLGHHGGSGVAADRVFGVEVKVADMCLGDAVVFKIGVFEQGIELAQGKVGTFVAGSPVVVADLEGHR